jgi:hypothetical protein
VLALQHQGAAADAAGVRLALLNGNKVMADPWNGGELPVCGEASGLHQRVVIGRVRARMATETDKFLERLRQLKAEFDEVHRRGMQALEAEDYEVFGVAIQQERAIIEEHGKLLESIRAAIGRLSPSVD